MRMTQGISSAWPCSRGYVALSMVAASLTSLASPTLAYDRNSRAVLGLEVVQDFSAETIESMRADMSVNFLEAALMQATLGSRNSDSDAAAGGGCSTPGSESCPWPSYSMTDANGVVHKCTVREDVPKTHISNKKTNDQDIATALDALEGRCTVLTDEFWSYKWCHRGDVTQFHVHEDGTTTSIDLGTHARTEVKLADSVSTESDRSRGTFAEDVGLTGDQTPAPEEKARHRNEDEGWVTRLLKAGSKGDHARGWEPEQSGSSSDGSGFTDVTAVYDFYEGGDSCEETGGARHTLTSITCCRPERATVDDPLSPPLATPVSIQEVSMCSYRIEVCSYLLCAKAGDESARGLEAGLPPSSVTAPSGSGSGSEPQAGGILDILEDLETCFPPKKESWWSYELCLPAGVRQYHEDTFQTLDGAHVQKVSTEFSLGKFDPSSVAGPEEDLIQKGTGGEDEGAVVLEFTRGTTCDLTGVLRSSTVFLKCGKSKRVVEVVEDRTCHYRVVALSPLLCRHPALMPKVVPIRKMECVPDLNGSA